MFAAKAYVPVVVGVLMLLLSQFGISETTTVLDAVTMFVTAAGVYLDPQPAERNITMRRLVRSIPYILWLYVLLRAIVVY